MVTNLKDLKAANNEDVNGRTFIDDRGRKWTITNIEKEFWAYAFRIAELAERLADAEGDDDDVIIDDCICDDCLNVCFDVCDCDKGIFSDGAEGVCDVFNYN
jgi:hypothetical protein